jgi:A/G-specific adenine glycosylase
MALVDTSPPELDRTLAASLRRKLLTWFARNRRDLPWRQDRDPYRIWVSEVMLQQTQVNTVIPYYRRFLEALPTLAALAAADERTVLRLWEGLGYYRRARDLHAAARLLVADQDGSIPDDPQLLGRLPGMGRYTCNAVLSQAYDSRLPILEANSQRVLARLFGQAGDPRRGPLRRWLWERAEQLLPRRRVGDFNQALMELGALVCTPAPRCERCPLADLCVAKQRNLQALIPPPSRPPEVETVREVAVVVRRNGRVLLGQCPPKGRWAGLWEFPRGSLEVHETHEEAAERCMRTLTGLDIKPGQEIRTVEHTITRFRITLVCLEASCQSGLARSTHYQQVRWVAPGELRHLPLSAPQRRLAEELIAQSRQRSMF